MKNITKQYQDLLEGKMSKANFMVNVRRDFPQWISPVNSFQDAVNILKSKRILSEDLDTQKHLAQLAKDSSAMRSDLLTHKLAKIAASKSKNTDDLGKVAKSLADEYGITDSEQVSHIVDLAASEYKIPATDYSQGRMGEADAGKHSGPISGESAKNDKNEDDDAKYDAMIAKREEEEENKYTKNYDAGGHISEKRLNEAAQKPEGRYKEATGKVEYDKFAEMDRVHYHQLMKGTEFELLKMPEISDENLVKAKKKAYSNLVKNPKYYMHLLISNEKDVEKKDKDLRMQPVKDNNRVDKANAMKVVKKDEGSNTQESLGNKEKAKGMPKGVKELPEKGVIGTEKVLRESLVKQLREEIMDEMMMAVGEKKTSFNKGARVETRDGEVGTVEECTPDNTVIIKLDGGGTIHMQGNVLKPYQDAPMVSQPVVAVQDTPAIAPEEPIADKFKGLKDKLTKGLEELIYTDPKDPKKTVVASSQQSQTVLTRSGYKPVPGTQDAK